MPDEAARRLFAQALVRLSPVQRQAVLLRLRDKIDIDGIATQLSLSSDSVRASLAFAIAQLRMALSDTPLDREQDDWLHRCRALLVQLPAPSSKPPPTAAPAVAHHAGLPRSALWGVVLGLLVLLGVGVLAWQRSAPEPVPTPPIETGPQRMPSPDAPEAPLTAPDFLLVLLQQQHPGVLEDLDFYVWLAEQDAVR